MLLPLHTEYFADMICGIDEAGRGPLAGPVTAAAVVLPPDFPAEFLNDSKLLSSRRREIAYTMIVERSVAWGVGWAWPEEIDHMNIHRATLLAMRRAYRQMRTEVPLVLVDGLHTPAIATRCLSVVRGDSKVREIMAASILAKVARDRWMQRYAWIDPRYGFDRHKGYPTAEHRRLCGELGLSPIHRRSFRTGARR